MSSLHSYDTTKSEADLKHRDYGLVLALICIAPALVVTSAVFAPVPIGSEISNQISLVGP